MSRERIDIKKDIIVLTAAIQKSQDRLKELERENLLFCDDQQWYTEEEVDQVVSTKPLKTKKGMRGNVHWKEPYKDGSTGQIIMIERVRHVRENGEWVNGY